MAKDIKAIQCPKCGSTNKEELKPDFYKCANCGTEYFLDSDDVHIYHHHEQLPPLQSSAPPGNNKLPVYILLGTFVFIAVAYFAAIALKPKTATTYNTTSTYKMPRMYYSSFVYTNTATGAPVYLRLGTDYIDRGNNKQDKQLHVQFNDAVDGRLIADRTLNDDAVGADMCLLEFKTYSPDLIYAIGCNTRLLQLDTRNNNLTDVTKELFKDYQQLSSGVAKLDFIYDKDMINVMSNDGNSFYYFPKLHQLADSKEQADAIWKKQFDKQFFEFGYIGDYFDHDKPYQLILTQPDNQTGHKQQRDLTPGRKYFKPKIIYQDKDNLLIVVGTTAADDPPVTIQSIDVVSGKIKWALAPEKYDLYSTCKCKQGFAIEYRKGDDADYAHGVLVISNTGELVNNYKLGRTE